MAERPRPSFLQRVEYVPEEPGTLLLLFILFAFLLFAPGGACSVMPPQHVDAHGDVHAHDGEHDEHADEDHDDEAH